jgi:sugar diacid utilization regulator
MFRIDICEPRQVVLVRFQGQLTEEDFAALDKLAVQVRGRAAFDCIYDMTDVQRIDLATSFVAQRGDLPQAYKDRARVYVVPQDDLKLLVRLYATYQANKGWRAPVIVRTLDEALRELSIGLEEFSPVAVDTP